MNVEQITKLSRTKVGNRAIVAMGYNSIESNIILSMGDGDKLPDPLVNGSYDLVWWNLSDYINPANDPYAEIVKCIAKVGDTVIVMRSQDEPSYDKNIIGKTYGMAPVPMNNTNTVDNTIGVLSYYNIPQTHSSSYHDATVETATGSTAKVTAHNTAATGVHGVGASTVESISGSQGKVDTHAAAVTPHASATSIGGKSIPSGGIADATTLGNHTTATTAHGSSGVVVGQTTLTNHVDATTPHALATSIGGKSIPSGGIADAGTLSGHTGAPAPHSGHDTPTQRDTAIGTAVSNHAGLVTGVHGTTTGYILGTEDMGVANGVASLDSNGKVLTSQLPGLAITSVYTAANQAAQLALSTQEGDVVVRSDENKSYVRNAGTAGTMADWTQLLTPTDVVTSVFGRTGVVTAVTNDYTWAMINKATSNIADITTKSHTSLTDIGSNTHAAIDTAIGTTLPGLVTTHGNLATAHGSSGTVLGITTADGRYAPIATGVTGGNAHDHFGGDGAQIDHTTLSNIGVNTHAQIDTAIGTTLPGLVTTHGNLTTAHGSSGTVLGITTADGRYAPIAGKFPIVSTGISYSALASDHTIVCTAAVTITIPAAGTAGTGKVYKIKSNYAGTVTITSTSLIDAATTYNMYARYETVAIQSDGTQWWVV